MQLLKTNETNFAKVVVYETEAPSVEILGFGDFHIGATDFSEELLYSIPCELTDMTARIKLSNHAQSTW